MYFNDFTRIGRNPIFDCGYDVFMCLRPYNISYTLIGESLSTLKNIYKNSYDLMVYQTNTEICCKNIDSFTADFFFHWFSQRRIPNILAAEIFTGLSENECIVFTHRDSPIKDQVCHNPVG